MQPTLHYRDFCGSIETDEDGCLFGRVLHIPVLVDYQGDDLQQLQAAFEEAVEDYLQCLQQLDT